MDEVIEINVDREAFVGLLNVLCDAILEDEIHGCLESNKTKLHMLEQTILSINELNADYPIRADLTFLKDLLPRMEIKYPGIFGFHSPILDFMKRNNI